MLSIRNSINELERLAVERDSAVECYRGTINNLAHYAVEVDEQTTSQYRRYVTALADGLCFAGMREASSTLRALFRDYKAKAAEYLKNVRDQLASTASALEAVMEALAQTDGDSDRRMSNVLGSLREIAQHPAATSIRDLLLTATNGVGQAVEDMRKQHQSYAAQFKTEIHMLHQRIAQLESAVTIDSVTQLLTRAEIAGHIQALGPCDVTLLLLTTSGLRLAEARYSGGVAAELAGAFAKRLRNTLPPNAVIGRWSNEEFVAILNTPASDVIKLAKSLGEQLSGMYSCLLEGKVVRPDLQVRLTVVEPAGGGAERLLARVNEYMTQPLARLA
jgi:GGDEF domain-containing protein